MIPARAGWRLEGPLLHSQLEAHLEYLRPFLKKKKYDEGKKKEGSDHFSGEGGFYSFRLLLLLTYIAFSHYRYGCFVHKTRGKVPTLVWGIQICGRF